MSNKPAPPNVPLVDLKGQVAALHDEIDEGFRRVLQSGSFVLGADVEAFEKEFAAFCGVRHAVGVNSGTSALHLALLTAGVKAGDEVITVPFTFVATVAAIEYAGAKPVLVDIDADSFTMDVNQLESRITSKTRAILPVHLYGQPADMGPIMELAAKHNLVVIEDAAQAHAARYGGRRTGSLGHIGCFSFYPTKNLGAFGEAGAVVTDNPEYAGKLRMLRDWGQESKYRHIVRGFNHRMEALQGVVLRTKLKHLADWTDSRRRLARRYDSELAGLSLPLPKELPNREHVYHIYAVRVRDRTRIQTELSGRGISTAVHYPEPVHLIAAYRDLGYGPGAFPVSEALADETLSLPLFPELTNEQQDRVIAALRALKF